MATKTLQCTQFGWAFRTDVELCLAAGTDAANKAMRKAGRSKWNDDDWNLAVAKQEALLENAAACCAEGVFMWPANAALTRAA